MVQGMRRLATRIGDRRAAGGWAFVARWVAAVGLSMVVAGVVEYTVATDQVRERSLESAAESYASDLDGLAQVLSSDLPPDALREAVSDELGRVARTYGTRNVTLYAADGRLVDAVRRDGSEQDKLDEVLSVASFERPSWAEEDDEGETGQEHRYEFLLPVRTADGEVFVVEVDQHATIIDGLLADLRERTAYGLLLGLLVVVPLSYLIGGRSLNRRQTRAQHAADTDALTRLAGRRPFRPMLQAALADPAAGTVVLALIDIDEFKGVNDRLGHSYGDRVLCSLADSFGALRASDTAFRLGGDEFAVVLVGSSDAEAVAAIERVRTTLSETVPWVTFSCGVAAAGAGEGLGLQKLWERADAALYEAKHRGRRQTVSYSAMSTSRTVSVEKLDAVTALLAADSTLEVAFQPIWDLREGRVLGHEALVRLVGDIPVAGPQEAFELAERLGVAAELDARARRAVLGAVGRRDWQGLLFLNVHPDALSGLDVDALVADLAAAGVAPSEVVLEVTEHDGLDRPEPIRVLKRAHARGFRLALDDMGAGNAGLRALTHVRFDVIKLDRHVTARLGIDPACDATAAAASTFVQQTGGWVIAEGIEDINMLNAVLDDIQRPRKGTPMLAGQGFYLGRPAPAPTPIDARLDRLAPARPHHASADVRHPAR